MAKKKEAASENISAGSVKAEPEGGGQKEVKEPVQNEPSELEKALAAAEDFKRKWYSVTAEYENYRKRNAQAV